MQLLGRYRPELAAPEAAALAALSDGSIGPALELADAGGLALYRSIVEMLSQAPGVDLARLHAFADELARADAEDGYRAAGELLSQFLARMAAGAARRRLGEEEIVAGESGAMQRLAARAEPARWAALREEIGQGFATADRLNLDRKQAMLGAFLAIGEQARWKHTAVRSWITAGPGPYLGFGDSDDRRPSFLRHDADLLRERYAAPRPCLPDRGRRCAGAFHAARRQACEIPDRHR